MIKVQTLRLRGLCASSLLALAACSGTPTDFVDVQTGSSEGTPLTKQTTIDDVTNGVQDPQGQDPQGRAATVKKAVDTSAPNGSSKYGQMSHFMHCKNVGDTVELGPVFGGILNFSYSQPNQCESPYSSKGRLTGTKILEGLGNEGIEVTENVDYFICAGNTVTPLIYKELVAAGVNKDRLHLEYFGPFVSVPEEENEVGPSAGLSDVPNKKISKCPFHRA